MKFARPSGGLGTAVCYAGRAYPDFDEYDLELVSFIVVGGGPVMIFSINTPVAQ
jgi:hypothetical protein